MKTKVQIPKKVLSVLLCALVLFSCVPMSVISASAVADDLSVTIDTGTEVTLKDSDSDGYYEIGTADELYAFAYAVNGGKTSINGKLTKDIIVNEGTMTADSTGVRVWTPIGNASNNYIGTFDGNNYTISGLYFNNSEAVEAGLVGATYRRFVIKNVGVTNSYISAKQYVGGIVGENWGTVTNCYNTSIVNATERGAGGIVGCDYGTIENCYNTGNISCNGDGGMAGGIAGYKSGTGTTNCYNTGSISGSSYIGGIIGENMSTITNCYNEGTVSANRMVGGVLGWNFGTVINCYNKGAISGAQDVGGVAGYNYYTSSDPAIIVNCYNTGDVSGTGREVGGVVGYNRENATITNCYNTGKVGGSAIFKGGVAGNNGNGTITNCYYLDTAFSGGIYGKDVVGSAEAKTSAQFESGEVAYLLQGEQTEKLWGQTIGIEPLPVPSGAKVYKVTSCKNEVAYSNNSSSGHIEVNFEEIAATCTESGRKAGKKCFACGEILTGLEEIPSTGHKKETVAEKAATCTEAGHKAGEKCSVCNTIFSGMEEISKLDHNYQNGFCVYCGYEPATLNDEGYYEIDNAGKLYWFAAKVNGGELNINAKLTKDIIVNEGTMTADSTGVREWTPIGDGGNIIYEGIFDGNNKTISGLYFNKGEAMCVGLFGAANVGSEIKNVGIIKSYFNGYNGVGGVVGATLGKVTNCYNTGTVNGTGMMVGGVVGGSNEIITNCYNTGTVNGGEQMTGGVVGGNVDGGKVTNCYNTGTVSGNSGVGGVVGVNIQNNTVENCYSTGTVSGNSGVGGVVGENTDSTVENCYYLDTAYSGGINGNDVEGSAEAKTTEQFKSGEVAYLLQGEQTEEVWGQTIGTQVFPLFGGAKVYGGYTSCKDVLYYTNNANDVIEEKPDHTYDNACDLSCNVCGEVIEGTPTHSFEATDYKWEDDYSACTVTGICDCGETTTETAYSTSKVLTPAHCTASAYMEFTVDFNAEWAQTQTTQAYDPNKEFDRTNHLADRRYQDNGDGTHTRLCLRCGVPIEEPEAHSRENILVEGDCIQGTVYKCDKCSIQHVGDKVQDKHRAGTYVARSNNGDGTHKVYHPCCNLVEIEAEPHTYTDGVCVCYAKQCDVDGHSYENGFCKVCGDYEPATLNSEGYYEIDNAGKLYWFAAKINSGELNINGKLTKDIIVNEGTMTADSTGAREWTPMGYVDVNNIQNIYEGIFDGNNKTISGLYFNSDQTYVGLFGATNVGSEIKNVGIIKSYVNGANCVGGVVGATLGKVTNCYNTGTVVGSGEMIGGVVGGSAGKITNCYNTGTVVGNGQGSAAVGGVVGGNVENGIVTNCYNTGAVSGDINIGGVVGGNHNSTITNCYNTGTVSGNSSVGGCVGISMENGTITNCYSTGTVSGNTYVGGVVGENTDSTVENCYYLDTAYSGGINGNDVEGSAEAKTTEQFKSGEVAYLLQGNQTEEVWGQTIGTENLPVLNGAKVYKCTNCKGDFIKYSNTDESTGHDYNSTHVCKNCYALEDGHIAGIAGYSLSLGGNIAVNYYMVLDQSVIDNKDGDAKVVFTVPSGASSYTVECPIKDATKSGNFYVFTCEVAAKEMTSDILCKVVSNGATSDTFTYSVKQYAEVVLANPDRYPGAEKLVKAMLNYGANAQVYFSHKTDNLANASLSDTDKALVDNLDLSKYAHSIEGTQSGVSFYGALLSLKSETAIKLYFEFENEDDVKTIDITVDGKAVTAVKNGDYYMVKISDIPANSLDKMYKIQVGDLILNYGAFSYGNIAMGTSKDILKNTIKAMYAYNQAAIEYNKKIA